MKFYPLETERYKTGCWSAPQNKEFDERYTLLKGWQVNELNALERAGVIEILKKMPSFN